MVMRYEYEKKKIIDFVSVMNNESYSRAISYLLRDSESKARRTIGFSTAERAIKHLDADYWNETLLATDILDAMPQKRRDEWYESIHKLTTPPFESETVINTLKELLLSRDGFLAEKVDGMFRVLSGDHVTNIPQGFRKRMIINRVFDKWGSACYSRTGYINDLRCIIAKFMGRDEPTFNDTDDVLKNCRYETGEWVTVDGGALKIKAYKVGTAHIEVHSDVADKLNDILSFLHPNAIPAEFRKKPSKKYQEFDFTQQLLPHSVLRVIHSLTAKKEVDSTTGESSIIYKLNGAAWGDKHLREKAESVIFSCGGVACEKGRYKFSYDFSEVRRYVVNTGTIPDQKAHQFYPTNNELSKELVDWCDIQPGHRCLEPEAGQGAIAKNMPTSTVCVEVSPLHCEILKCSNIKNVICADFIKWAKTAPLFDRICMNPPFSQGRAEQHLNAAAALLDEGGVLTAILPVSMMKKDRLSGFEYEWGEPRSGEFKGVSIDIVMVKLTRRMFA